MKTAISLPNALYAEAEKAAKSMGIPRSQLFAQAVEEFLYHHKKERITEKLNEVYKKQEAGDITKMTSVTLDSLRELTQNDSW